MNNDITQNPERTVRGFQELQRPELTHDDLHAPLKQEAFQMRAAAGKKCPFCGTINEPDAMFCESCGNPIGKVSCPNCGTEIDPDADFCESCHHYIKSDVCSFCGAHLSGYEAFCPDCGNPKGGIVCPVCNTLNDFSFCKQCGTPLTDDARMLLMKVKETPEYKEMQQIAHDVQQLEMAQPYSSERDMIRDQKNSELRDRVLRLLAQDRGIFDPVIPEPEKRRMSKAEYDAKKQDRLNKLAEILEKMAQAPQPKPAQVRNYAMACKPQGVRLVWECNYKHAFHSSPCGCAKPQLGGKWVVLGRNSKKEIKDDI